MNARTRSRLFEIAYWRSHSMLGREAEATVPETVPARAAVPLSLTGHRPPLAEVDVNVWGNPVKIKKFIEHLAALHLQQDLLSKPSVYKAAGGRGIEAHLLPVKMLTTAFSSQDGISAPNVLVRRQNEDVLDQAIFIQDEIRSGSAQVIAVTGGLGTGKSVSANFLFLQQFCALQVGTLQMLFFRVDRALFCAQFNQRIQRVTVEYVKSAGCNFNQHLLHIKDVVSYQAIAANSILFLVEFTDTELGSPGLDFELRGRFHIVFWAGPSAYTASLIRASRATVVWVNPPSEEEIMLSVQAMYELQPESCKFAYHPRGIHLPLNQALEVVAKRAAQVGPNLRLVTCDDCTFDSYLRDMSCPRSIETAVSLLPKVRAYFLPCGVERYLVPVSLPQPAAPLTRATGESGQRVHHQHGFRFVSDHAATLMSIHAQEDRHRRALDGLGLLSPMQELESALGAEP
jgi:hypothetical protein